MERVKETEKIELSAEVFEKVRSLVFTSLWVGEAWDDLDSKNPKDWCGLHDVLGNLNEEARELRKEIWEVPDEV